MKFLPTPNLWNAATQSAVISGQIKLQQGQWVDCGGTHKSRYVGVSNGGTLYIAHWNGSAANQRQRYQDLKTALGART